MDQPVQSCVIDAKTLTDHIHGIKKLIYDGHIRLTVPSSTSESVEKSYQKSIEPKPEPKEAARPKSSGRPVKVYPTFDINPRVARDFLERFKSEDNALGVEFQKEAGEEYTPWKNLKEQEEKQKAPDAKPTGYAAALLAKLNIEEAPVQASKGPVKPKLVARSPNGLNGAWKKCVPTVSAAGISVSSRSILGYTLWRLHERETYSFVKDASILVTDDKDLSVAAKKVGINVQTFEALIRHVSAQAISDTDRLSWGDVERDFGIAPPTKASSVNGHIKPNEEIVGEDTAVISESEQLPVAHIGEDDPSSYKKEHEVEEIKLEGSNGVQSSPVSVQEAHIGKTMTQKDQLFLKNMEETMAKIKAIQNFKAKDSSPEHPQQAEAEAVLPRTRAYADVVSNRIRPIGERYPTPAVNIPEPSHDYMDNTMAPLMDRVDDEKANNIADWVRTVNANMDDEAKSSPKRSTRKRSPRNKKTERSSPPQEPPAKPLQYILMQRAPKSSQAASDKAPIVSEKAHSPSPPQSLQPLVKHQAIDEYSLTQDIEMNMERLAISPPQPVEIAKPTTTSPPTQTAEEAHATSQHRSTESTASSLHTVASKNTSIAKSAPIEELEDSEEEVVVFNPRAKRLSAQQQLQKSTTEEQPVIREQTNGTTPGHTKHLSVEESGLVEQQRNEKPVPMMVSAKQHRQPKPKAAPIVIDPDAFGRDFASNPQASHHNASHRPRSRPVSQHGPLRPVPQHGFPRGGGGTGRGGRPFIHPQALPPMQNGQHGYLNGNNRGGRQNRMSSANVPKVPVVNIPGNVAVNAQTTSQPSPRPSPRVNPQQSSQVNAPDPDVDFVLQSGPPRGSTRGRGKLFIP